MSSIQELLKLLMSTMYNPIDYQTPAVIYEVGWWMVDASGVCAPSICITNIINF